MPPTIRATAPPPPTWRHDATGLSVLIGRGDLSPEALLEHCLVRIERLEPVLNAFTHVDRAGARRDAAEAARRAREGRRLGPLDGVPVSVKDNLHVRDMPARWGSLLFRDFVPERDDICVERLRTAGAVILGKTTTPEFALSGRTVSRLTGITRNPWDPALTPGGSSGGAVASVAAGMVPLAIGTDAGGSTRLPAGYTGLVGLRPSTGRLARAFGFPPMAIDFQVIGPIARTLRDLELLYAVLAGPDARDPASLRLPPAPPVDPARRLRIGWFTAIGEEAADAEVVGTVREAVRQLAAGGCIVEECAPPFDLAALRAVWGTLTAVGAARVARRFPDRWRAEVGPVIAPLVERGLGLGAADYVDALDRLAAFRAEVSANWEAFDAFVTPTAPAPAWPAEAEHPARIGGRPGSAPTQGMFGGWVNATGSAAISVPGRPHPDGRPIGVQIVAPFGADAVVLELARRLERAAPWAQRWPALAEQAGDVADAGPTPGVA